MAERRKPRIRKAPTFAEAAEATRAKAGKEKPRKIRKAVGKATAPLTKIRLPKNPLTRFLVRILRIVIKGLNWLVPRYFLNAWRELRQVTWPTRRETWRLTGAVFIFSIIFGALVALVDKGLDEFFKKVILK